MHPSTRKGNDFGRRCYSCIAEVGRQNLMACSRCQRVRYCSPACQKNHWKYHKIMCRSAVERRATIHPDSLLTYNVLDEALKKWTNHWTFTLHRWACLGIDLVNHPPNRAATHCCVVRIQRRSTLPSRSASQAFMMTSAEILSNEEVFKILWVEIGPTREEFEAQKKKMQDREDNMMCLVIICEGLTNFRYFQLEPLDSVGTTPSNLARAIADNWSENLIHIIETGDMSKENSDRHILRTLPDDMAGVEVYIL